MKNYGLLVLLILFYQVSFTQAPSIEIWDGRFGGTGEDDFGDFVGTRDGGYILTGTSNSPVSGNKTQPDWDTTSATSDYWVVKIDSLGKKQWDKRFGGTGDDFSYSIVEANDGSYLVGGGSGSDESGDRSQPSWGGFDFWVVKTDVEGNKQWDKRFGGTLDDLLYEMCVTRDDGFLLGGFSNSRISGDKTQDNWDTTRFTDDYWIVKIDSVGNKQWDKRFGGTGEDGLYTILPTPDGGYILGGVSSSDSSGNKSENQWGFGDYWVVKIDSLGNKQWDKDYGGRAEEDFGALQLTHDGGYILAGYSISDSSGNKTVSASGDWVLKIDSVGNIVWQKVYDIGNRIFSIKQTFDHGFILSMTPQAVLLKIDSVGNIQWTKVMENNGLSQAVDALEMPDGCYVTGVTTNAGVGGYKSEPNWDVKDSTFDYWLVKFCYTGIAETIPSAVQLIENTFKLQIYPDPFDNQLSIKFNATNTATADLMVYNVIGQAVYKEHEASLSPTYTKMLDLSYLPNGVYWVSVVVDGERVTREVVKQ